MEMRIFTIYLDGRAEAAESELNGFLRSHRVLFVERHFVADGSRSFWTVCVEYLDGGGGASAQSNGARKKRVDYMEVLPPEEFAVFARLRETRKKLAEAEAVPPYVVFTDEQLAAMVTGKVNSVAGLRKIDGVGEAKAKKYGADVLEVLCEGESNAVP